MHQVVKWGFVVHFYTADCLSKQNVHTVKDVNIFLVKT